MDAWGKLTAVDLRFCNENFIKDQNKITAIIIELCALIGMKRFGDMNIVKFGSDDKVAGFSFTQLIETSLVSGHLVDATNHAYIDIFSCKDYDSEKSANFLQDSLEAQQMTFKVISRF